MKNLLFDLPFKQNVLIFYIKLKRFKLESC